MKITKEGIIFLVFISLITLLPAVIIININSEIDEVKSKVGQKLILQGDTLMIIDYSILSRNYTLEDGRQISFNLADELEPVEVDKTKD